MRILAFATNIPHVENFAEIVRGGVAVGQQLEVMVVTLEKWYLLGALPTLLRYGIEAYDMPRPSGSKKSYWHTENIQDEVTEAYPLIEQRFEGILSKFRPHVFLTCSDDGRFEAGFLRSCRRFRVPSILLAEMPMTPMETVSIPKVFDRAFYGQYFTQPRRSSSLRNYILSVELKRRINRLFSAIRSKYLCTQGDKIPRVRPMGMNGATVIAAPGEKCAERLVARGIPGNKVVITGWPRLDRLYRFVQSHLKLSGKWSNLGSRPIEVLYVDSGYGLFGEDLLGPKLLEYILEAAEIVKGRAQIGVRFKPWEGKDLRATVWPEVKGVLDIVDNTEDLYQQLNRAHVVVGNNSAVQAEAMMMGLPVINLMSSESDDWKEFVSSGAALPAVNAQGLSNAILKIADNLEVRNRLSEAVKPYLGSWYYRFDGRSGARVVDVTLKLCQP